MLTSVLLVTEIYVLVVAETIVLLVTKNSALLFTDYTTPRDRNGTFEPEIIALYARGASYGDIRDHLSEMYDLDVSPATISRVTDKILPLIQEWRNRPLEAVYPFVWLDAIHSQRHSKEYCRDGT